MKLSMPTFLKSKITLYIALFLGITNIVGLIAKNDWNSVVFFVIVALLANFFTKNMSVILITALVATNLLYANLRFREGMSHGKKKKKGGKKKKKKEKFGQRNVPSSTSKSLDGDDSAVGSRIDQAATLEQSYDNLQSMLGGGGIQKLTSETRDLINQQKSLMGSIKDIAPMVKSVKGLVKDMGGLENLKLDGFLKGKK
jgi:hypothetical protein